MNAFITETKDLLVDIKGSADLLLNQNPITIRETNEIMHTITIQGYLMQINQIKALNMSLDEFGERLEKTDLDLGDIEAEANTAEEFKSLFLEIDEEGNEVQMLEYFNNKDEIYDTIEAVFELDGDDPLNQFQSHVNEE